MGYRLGVDTGTTYTAAAVCRAGRAEMVGLGNRATQVPSVVFLRPDGEFLVAEAAEARGLSEPERVVREFKRRIGDPVPILIGGSPFSAEALTARLLSWVVRVATEREGEAPESITVAYPANWGSYKSAQLGQAFQLADLSHVEMIIEPEAAAIAYASRRKVADGSSIAVYDLGGGTFDAAVLRNQAGRFHILGQPEGIEHLGGVDFDEAVFQHVLRCADLDARSLDLDDAELTFALERLRRDCVLAKETLSVDIEASVAVVVGTRRTRVRLIRSEFEDMLRSTLEETIGAMRRVFRSAGIEPEAVSAIVLVGGSSRIPLVAELLVGAFGRPLAMDTHPKHDIALGAALGWVERLPPPAAPQPKESAPPPTPTPTSAPLRSREAVAKTTPVARQDRDPPQRAPTKHAAIGRPGSGGLGVRTQLSTFAALVLVALILAFVPWEPLAKGSRAVKFDGNSAQVTDTRAGRITVSLLGFRSTKRVESNGSFDLPFDKLLLAGPVHATLDVVGAKPIRLQLIPLRTWFQTIPGWVLLASPFFVGAYASPLLRAMRRRRRAAPSQVAAMIGLGAVVGLALDDASWIVTHNLMYSFVAVAVVLLTAAASALVPTIVVRSTGRRGRSAASR